MPFVSTSQYIRGLLDGLTIPGDLGDVAPLTALVTPYDPDESGEARAYIWPSRARELRCASPRMPATVQGAPALPNSAGVKHKKHLLDVYLTGFAGDWCKDVDTAFPALIDVVEAALRGAPDPAPITDPLTGFASELVGIGENLDTQYPPMVSTADQRIDRYSALIVVEILEQFSA